VDERLLEHSESYKVIIFVTTLITIVAQTIFLVFFDVLSLNKLSFSFSSVLLLLILVFPVSSPRITPT